MKQKYSESRIEAKKNTIIPVATNLFLKKGIDNVKMTDVADEALIGVASLYRYFNVKKSLVIACGIYLWKEKIREFEDIEKENRVKSLNGIRALTNLFYHFVDIFDKSPSFFLFLSEFDNFVIKEKIKPEDLKDYNDVIMKMHDIFFDATRRGQEDGTVKDFPFDVSYFAFSKALIGLAEKLIAEGKIISSDNIISPDDQIMALLNIILTYLAKGEN